MALKHCPDCGKEVSTEPPSCPYCGRPFRPQKTDWLPDPVQGAIVCGVLSVLIIVMMASC